MDRIRQISRLYSEDEGINAAILSLVSDLRRCLESMKDDSDAALDDATESIALCRLIAQIVKTDDDRMKSELLDKVYSFVTPPLYRGLIKDQLHWVDENRDDAGSELPLPSLEPPTATEAPNPVPTLANGISTDAPEPGGLLPEALESRACGGDALLPDGGMEEDARELEELAEVPDELDEIIDNGTSGDGHPKTAEPVPSPETSHRNAGGSDRVAVPREPVPAARSAGGNGNLKQLFSCALTSPAVRQKAIFEIEIKQPHAFKVEKLKGIPNCSDPGQVKWLADRKPQAADKPRESDAAQLPKALWMAPNPRASQWPATAVAPAQAAQSPQPAAEKRDAKQHEEPSTAPRRPVEAPKDGPDVSNLSARAYAAFLAERANRPDLAATLSLLRKLLSDQRDDCTPERDDLLDALVFVKALTLDSRDEKIGCLYHQLLLATDIPLDKVSYDGTIKTSAFEDGGMLPGLEIAAMLRATLAPSAMDFMLYSAAEAMVKSDDCFPDWAHKSKQLLNAMLEVKSFPGGFSDATLSKLDRRSFGERYASELSWDARKYLDTLPVIKQKITGLPEMLNLCFGPNSDLSEALDIVARNDQGDRAIVCCALELYGSDSALDDFVDTKWKVATQGQKTKHMKLGMLARKDVLDAIHERLDLLRKWLETVENRIDAPEVLARLRGQLLKQIGAAEEEARSAQKAQVGDGVIASRVLANILHSMDLRLSMRLAEENRLRFFSLLGGRQIALDENGFPDFDERLGSVQGYEPWRRALRHIAEPVLPLEEVLKATGDRGRRHTFDNLFSARLICRYLKETKGREIQEDYSADRKSAEEDAIAEKGRLLEDLEMAFAYGRISEELQQRLAGYIGLADDTLFKRADFGRWRSFVDALKAQVESETDINGTTYEARYCSVLENPATDKNNGLIRAVRKNLDEKNFIVAEEYLNRYESGERNLPESDLAQDEHARFLALYSELYRFCELDKGNALRNWGFRKLEPLFDSSWATGQKNDARGLIESWPNRNMVSADSIEKLFKRLGFDVQSARKHGADAGKKYERFALEVTSAQKGLADYHHPIARFGTMLNSPLEVVCVFGARTAKELVNIMVELHLGENAILLFDSALELTERRQLAESFRSKTSGLNSFLLVDRVLMLFLATLESRERLPGLLKCALPYTYYQPFNNGSGPIADEMFMGRKKELSSIMAANGANLVYGGRQLGKTALLERAQSMLHKPGRREYALVFSAYNCANEAQALAKTAHELDREGIIGSLPQSWEALCGDLADRFREKKIAKLVLLMDEADAFLEDASRRDYRVLSPLIELRRKTGNNFKFVLAGLHNVARAKRAMERNGILAQLGEPLCIRPLSPLDARHLMERPLSYLGFETGAQPLMEWILASSNYYPGILHFFGYRLIESISERYTEYYSAAKGNPPFLLQEKQLRSIITSENLTRSIREKLEWTLKLDPRYQLIANQVAWNYYENDKSLGCDVRGLYRQAEEFDISLLRRLEFEDYALLFDELVDMGIFSKTEQGLYRLRRNDFLHIIGSRESVESVIADAMGAAV